MKRSYQSVKISFYGENRAAEESGVNLEKYFRAKQSALSALDNTEPTVISRNTLVIGYMTSNSIE